MSELSRRAAKRYLAILAQDQGQPQDHGQGQGQEPDLEEEGSFGGPGPFVLPDDHVAGLRVPKGGSCCANCAFGSEDEDGDPACQNPDWIAWNGGDPKLPAPADEYCSDWWRPAE